MDVVMTNRPLRLETLSLIQASFGISTLHITGTAPSAGTFKNTSAG